MVLTTSVTLPPSSSIAMVISCGSKFSISIAVTNSYDKIVISETFFTQSSAVTSVSIPIVFSMPSAVGALVSCTVTSQVCVKIPFFTVTLYTPNVDVSITSLSSVKAIAPKPLFCKSLASTTLPASTTQDL